ncbi:MAG: DUF2271 domain-containing protein [Marinobacterium sp.]|nr:DUF2271 domain-containing protein [Marinobacterium sp.]
MISCRTLLAVAVLALAPVAQAASVDSAVIDPAVSAPAVVELKFELPLIDNGDARRPFVAVWVESEGKALRSLALWMDDNEWEADLRRWWRKAGRYGHAQVDAVTSATRGAGQYALYWDGLDAQGRKVNSGRYQLVLEAVREDGNRTLLKQSFELGNQSAAYQLPAGKEIGPVFVTVNPL